MRSKSLLAFAIAIGVTSFAASLHACNVPVFRYALENWRPDPYQVYVLYDGELTTDQQQLVDKLTAASIDREPPANMVVHEIEIQTLRADEANDSDADGGKKPDPMIGYLRRWADEVTAAKPHIVALYPWQMQQAVPAWSGELTDANVQRLVDSPVRQEVARRILAGQSAVWVLLESGNPEKDDKVFQQLQQWLATMPARVSLPDRGLIESDEAFRPDTPIELKVEFSVIRVSRDDPDERAIVSMLLGSEDDLRDFDEPIAIPIYGRGRTYFALVGRGINDENVRDNCQFICGACSCQVKQENPGVDLLLPMNWDDHILGSALADKPMPELTGVGFFEVEPEEDATLDSEASKDNEESIDVTSVAMNMDHSEVSSTSLEAEESVVEAKTATEESADFEGKLLLGVGGLLMVGVIVLAGLTVMLRRQSNAG